MNCGRRCRCYLSRQLVEHDRNELVGQFEVCGLEDMIGTVKNNERVARDVSLEPRRCVSLWIRLEEYVLSHDDLLALPGSCCYSLEPSLRSAGKYSSHRAEK